MKEAPEKELMHLRGLGAYEKVDELVALAKCNFTPVDTKWVDIDKAFEVEPRQIRSHIVAREFKNEHRPDLCAVTLSYPSLRVTVQSSH